MKSLRWLFVLLSLALLPGCAAILQSISDDLGKQQNISKTFSLAQGGSDSLSFPINARGRISVSARWKNPDQPLKVTITDPSGNIATQTSGISPLNVSYKVTSTMSQGSGQWTASIINESGASVSGNFKANYPYLSEEGQTSTGSTGGNTGGDTTTSEPYPPPSPDQGNYPPPSDQGNYPPPSNQGGGTYDQGGGGTYTSQNPPPPQDQGGGYNQGGGYGQTPPPPQNQGGGTPQDQGGGYSQGGGDQQQQPSQPSSGQTYIPSTTAKGYSFYLRSTGNNRKEIFFTVNTPGTIQVNAQWTGNAGQLALVLNGPGQQGYYARRDGISPLSLSFDVTQEHINKGRNWSLSIANFDQQNTTAKGKLYLDYPRMQTIVTPVNIQAMRTLMTPKHRTIGYNFNLIGASSGKDKEVAFAVTTPGIIKISASWKGNANQMALILNGPGQTAYYARKDGPSPLSVEFNVTGEHIQKGTEWRAKIVNFDSALTTAVGRMAISYP